MFSHWEWQLDLIRCLNAQMFWMRNQGQALGWWQRQHLGTISACELPQHLPSSKTALFNLLCSGWLNLNLHSNSFLLTSKRWSHESAQSFCGEGVSAKILGLQWAQGALPLALGSAVPFLSSTLLYVAMSSFSSPSWQLAFVWEWNKLVVLKVSCSAMAPNPAVQPCLSRGVVSWHFSIV